MAVLDEVRAICRRLAPAGWGELLGAHGLDLMADDLATELRKPLSIDRRVPGFEDFAPQGLAGITPGLPAHSLLYHALASPNVGLTLQGQPLPIFPSLSEIESVLNYVYASRQANWETLLALAAGRPMAIIPFAVEYRPRAQSGHRQHADLCFSRTAIARVGTDPALYQPALRGYLPTEEGSTNVMRVIPAHFGSYLSVQSAPEHAADTGQPAADGAWLPLHKLFEGPECLTDTELTLSFEHYHVNEKLRQFHLRYPEQGWEEPHISQFPFRITEDLVEWQPEASQGMARLSPLPHPRLIELAYQDGQPVSFHNPGRPSFNGYIINRRYQLGDDGQILDLNTLPNVEAIEEAGGYRAMHFIDFTADGWVRVQCPELDAQGIPSVAAYSIVAAPDFYPGSTQQALVEWVQQQPFGDDIWNTRVLALSQVRVAGNPLLPEDLFSATDTTITAVVVQEPPTASAPPHADLPLARRACSLPDGAAGIFSPGWEIASDGSFVPNYLCAHQLGSPFTEDVRVCAAMGGFWPSVVPDSSRTFRPRQYMTVVPLTDAEIGQSGLPSWDGVTPPELLDLGGQPVVQYTAYGHTDYTHNALLGQLSLTQTALLSASDYQTRIARMQGVYVTLGASSKDEKRQWAVLSFQQIARPDSALQEAEAQAGQVLEGAVFYFHMYRHGQFWTPEDITKVQVQVVEMAEVFTGANGQLLRRHGQLWQVAGTIGSA